MGRLSGWGSVRGRPRGVGLVPDLVEDLTLEHDEIGIGDQVDGARPRQLDRDPRADPARAGRHHEHHVRSEEHTSELQSLMRISYAVFCLKKKKNKKPNI